MESFPPPPYDQNRDSSRGRVNEGSSRRYSRHRPYLRYYPFTVMQEVNPFKYNVEYLKQQVCLVLPASATLLRFFVDKKM